jgi:hypothetical protein
MVGYIVVMIYGKVMLKKRKELFMDELYWSI